MKVVYGVIVYEVTTRTREPGELFGVHVGVTFSADGFRPTAHRVTTALI